MTCFFMNSDRFHKMIGIKVFSLFYGTSMRKIFRFLQRISNNLNFRAFTMKIYQIGRPIFQPQALSA